MSTSKSTSKGPSKSKTRRASKAAPTELDSPTIVPVTGAIEVHQLDHAVIQAAPPRYHEDRHASIAEAAYFRSQHRGFAPGHEIEDWLAAEEEVDQRLLGEGRAG
jgi:Protein of unknown function (DUF2934)